jgi:hypothetical protein
MATTGVYRESVFEAFRSVATQRQIRAAIALAKQVGLRSDPRLRDAELGTYYQVDVDTCQRAQAALAAASGGGDDLAAQVLTTTQTLQAMVNVAAGVAIALLCGGGFCLLSGRLQTAAIFWCSGFSTAAVWTLQRQLIKRLSG